MQKLLPLLLVLLTIIPQVENAKKMKIHWLNNGGRIISSDQDWIRITITTTEMKSSITCPGTTHYTYTPGVVRRFDNLYVPVNGIMSISIEQINFLSTNTGVSINHNINTSQIGFYEVALPISLFVEHSSIGLEYQGFGVTIDVGGYTSNGDYYLLLELTNQDITIPNLPSQCSQSFGNMVMGILGMGLLLIMAVMY